MSVSSLFRHYNVAPTGPLLSKTRKTIQTRTRKILTYSRCFLPCSVSSCQIQTWHLSEEKMWRLYWVLVCVSVCDGVPSFLLPLGHSLWGAVIFKCACTSCVLTSVQPKHICLKVAQINRSVWIKCCVWGKNVVCVRASSRLAYFLFLTTWETTSQGRQTTSHITGILISCLSLFTSHPHVPSPFPFHCFSSPFASFCTLFCFLISYFHSFPFSHSFGANC